MVTTLLDPITAVCRAVETRVREALSATGTKWSSSIMPFPVAASTFIDATRKAPHVAVMWRDARGGERTAALELRLQLMVVLIVRAQKVEDLPIRANAAGVATMGLLHRWQVAIVLDDPQSAPQPVGVLLVEAIAPVQVDQLRAEGLTLVGIEASIRMPMIDARAAIADLPPYEGLDVDWRVAGSDLANPQAIDAAQEDTDG